MLGKLWQKIERGLRFIGLIQSSIILGLFYYLILGVVAIPYQIVKIFKPKRRNLKTYWEKRLVDDAAGLLNQF